MVDHQKIITQCLESLNRVILGKTAVTELALATLLARGSLLIEDRPGFGKTTLAKSLAKILGLSFQRIQCTNDLLPLDILGRFDYRHSTAGEMIRGPIFASIVLLDELNRAPARTQSAFLQAMEEGEVTVEGQTFGLPKPQMFIATQNPSDQIGTTLLPESELDRFATKISLGAPDIESEKAILLSKSAENVASIQPLLNPESLIQIQELVENLHVSDAILTLVARFLSFARSRGAMLSPRAGRDVIRVSRALAWMRGQDHLLPEDIKRTLPFVIAHRHRDTDALLSNFPIKRKRIYAVPTVQGFVLLFTVAWAFWISLTAGVPLEQWFCSLMTVFILLHLVDCGMLIGDLEIEALPFDPPFAGQAFSVPRFDHESDGVSE